MKRTATDSFSNSLELKAHVDRLAVELDRPRSWIIREALTIGLPVIEQYHSPAQAGGNGHQDAPDQALAQREPQEAL